MQSKNAKFLGLGCLGCVGAVVMMCLCIGAFVLIGGDSAASPIPTRRPTSTPKPIDVPTATPKPPPVVMPTLPAARVPIAQFADTCIFYGYVSEPMELEGRIVFEWYLAPTGATIDLLINRASDGLIVGSIVEDGPTIGEQEIHIEAGTYELMILCEDAVFDLTVSRIEQ